MKTYRISYSVGNMRYGEDYLAECHILALQQFCHDSIVSNYYDFKDIKEITVLEV